MCPRVDSFVLEVAVVLDELHKRCDSHVMLRMGAVEKLNRTYFIGFTIFTVFWFSIGCVHITSITNIFHKACFVQAARKQRKPMKKARSTCYIFAPNGKVRSPFKALLAANSIVIDKLEKFQQIKKARKQRKPKKQSLSHVLLTSPSNHSVRFTSN